MKNLRENADARSTRSREILSLSLLPPSLPLVLFFFLFFFSRKYLCRQLKNFPSHLECNYVNTIPPSRAPHLLHPSSLPFLPSIRSTGHAYRCTNFTRVHVIERSNDVKLSSIEIGNEIIEKLRL